MPSIEDLAEHISLGLDQIVFRECEPALNSIFWDEYRCIRFRAKQDLQRSGISGLEYTRLMRNIVSTRLHSQGWEGFINNDGCIEFL